MREENEKYPFKRILGKCVKEKAVLLNKKSVHDGVKASYAHMSPVKGDASQGAFSDIPEISKNRYFLHNKKSFSKV